MEAIISLRIFTHVVSDKNNRVHGTYEYNDDGSTDPSDDTFQYFISRFYCMYQKKSVTVNQNLLHERFGAFVDF